MKRTPVTTFCIAFIIGITLVALSCVPKKDKANENTIHFPLGSNVKSLDPALSTDLYSNIVLQEIYDGLFDYHYLKRPVVLKPNLAKSMPQVSKDGLTYDIELKEGVQFHDDPAFKETGGKGREMVAEDFVYSIKRIADTKVGSTGWWLFADRIKGLNEFREASKSEQPTDYSKEVEGLKATAKHRVRLILERPYPQLLYALAMSYSLVVPHELFDTYGADSVNHAVGTGPYMLKKWIRDLRFELVRNPNYREDTYPSEGEAEDEASGLLADKGKKIPFADKVVLHVFRESQPLWLNFIEGNLDAAAIPKDSYDNTIDESGNLREQYQKLGMTLIKGPYPDVTFLGFNMNDPILGKNKNLRYAMSYAYNTQKRIDLLYNGRAVPAHGAIPPGISGYDPDFVNPRQSYDVEKAKEYMVKAGYPGGKGLPTLTMESVASTTGRQFDEMFRREMEAIGIRVKINANTWPEFLSKVHKQQAQLFGLAWHADYPDGENFLALFYGPNESPGTNQSNYSNPEYDKLYEKVRVMYDSKERNDIYKKMNAMVVEDAPMVFVAHRLRFSLFQKWLKNYKPHPIANGLFKYYRVDTNEKKDALENF